MSWKDVPEEEMRGLRLLSSAAKLLELERLYAEGWSNARIAEKLGISRSKRRGG
jgi:DNA-binding NarL/FixJ family response regulator